ncbi:MAG: DUF4249 family protein [Balneolaceae bacterium]|nr:DUF4249 family protein [Balneolaceae bacterium]
MIKYLTPIPMLLFLFAGCELYPQDEFEEDYVVEAYLVANRQLPQVRLSTTAPAEAKYQFSDVAIDDADVEVRLLDEDDGSIERRFPYVRRSIGVYVTNIRHEVLPTREYQLSVRFSNTEDSLTATTFVPGEFGAQGATADSIAYQDPAQIVINTSRSFYPSRQAFFIFSVDAIDPQPEKLTPFYNDQVNEQDEDIRSFYTNSSGIVNEENYEFNDDGTITLRVPWLAVAFYEDNFIIANAIDDNMYDFYRTQDVQGGGSTLPPGEFQNIIYNVEGGIGVFGSLASDTVRVFVKRNSQE